MEASYSYAEFVTLETVENAKSGVIKKKGIKLVKEISFERMREDMCVQILHIGPYSTEHESLQK